MVSPRPWDRCIRIFLNFNPLLYLEHASKVASKSITATGLLYEGEYSLGDLGRCGRLAPRRTTTQTGIRGAYKET